MSTAELVPPTDLSRAVNPVVRAAEVAGYDVAVNDRGDAVDVVGVSGAWHFFGTRSRTTWLVFLRRPGWPIQKVTVTELRAILKAQTPTDLGRPPRHA